MMKNSWITLWDTTQEARVVYVSESITDSLGWEPEEIIGRASYDLFHPRDHNSLRTVHSVAACNDRIRSLMVSYSMLAKNGSYFPVETILHHSHDALIGSTYLLYDTDAANHKARTNSVDQVFVCLPDGNLQRAGAWHGRQEAAKVNNRRFCLILNKFSKTLNIVHVSRSAKELVSLDAANAIGTSLYQYLQGQDAISLTIQIGLAKELGMVVRIRFDWCVDSEKRPVEAIASSTDDGIVMVFRLSYDHA